MGFSKAFILTCKSKVHRHSSQKPGDIVKSKRQESEKKPKQENRRQRYKLAKFLKMKLLSFVINNTINWYNPYEKQYVSRTKQIFISLNSVYLLLWFQLTEVTMWVNM